MCLFFFGIQTQSRFKICFRGELSLRWKPSIIYSGNFPPGFLKVRGQTLHAIPIPLFFSEFQGQAHSFQISNFCVDSFSMSWQFCRLSHLKDTATLFQLTIKLSDKFSPCQVLLFARYPTFFSFAMPPFAFIFDAKCSLLHHFTFSVCTGNFFRQFPQMLGADFCTLSHFSLHWDSCIVKGTLSTI